MTYSRLTLCVTVGRLATFFFAVFHFFNYFFNNKYQVFCFYKISKTSISVKDMKSLIVNCKNKIYKNK